MAGQASARVIDPGTMRGVENGAVALSAPTGKSPVLAAFLSLIIVGVGQFYNGDTKKGALMLAIALVFGAATGGLLWLGLAIWSAVDAYKVASGTGKVW
jgi:TM2 domain-containing membrane protein YozV